MPDLAGDPHGRRGPRTIGRLAELRVGQTEEEAMSTVSVQVTAVTRAQSALREIGAKDRDVHDRLLAAFGDLVAAVRDLRDVFARPNRGVTDPDGSAGRTIAALGVADSMQHVTERARVRRQAADAVGVHACGAIPWRPGS
ncbi:MULTISPECIES: hypothetical protein [Actinomadura]|uniref:Uncharacterized protein n=1 Tax=Actinomadura yumaensis TaxID=111807 RepID=A0ABW2CRW4_9ACTN|nr:hypothetical protein [Actinomadura sp. J1-007]MWK34101.1 hypothetical protein [Actinomadura sp. J1-007]